MTTPTASLLALSQPGIMADPLALGASLSFQLLPDADPGPALLSLREAFSLDCGVVALGPQPLSALGVTIAGLRPFPALSGPATVPSTQHAMWVNVRGANATQLFDRIETVKATVYETFSLEDAVTMFTYAEGRDLSGYIDGTGNPHGNAAIDAALSAGPIPGASFVAVQRWVHDLRQFASFPLKTRDEAIGIFHATNGLVYDAPASSHVKRTDQKLFNPPAFIVRRSMPWANGLTQGLEFIAYGATLDAFERQLRRMAGIDDGIVDALFTFSRPVTGGYYWCPPASNGKLDLSPLGL